MNSQDWAKIKGILCDALELEDPLQRAELISQRCSGDPSLLADVQRLVAGHENSDLHFLEPPQNPLLLKSEWIAVGERYVIDGILGHGGVSVVYLAHDRQMAMRRVVIKMLNERAARSAWIRSKFRHEMEALVRIRHPGVVQALDFFQIAGDHSVLVMEYVQGRWLRHDIVEGGMPLQRVERLLHQMGDALNEAHSKGVQHRDLKPENVILRETPQGEVATLIDFGIAKVESPEHAMLSDTVVLAGTTGYMAPEQLLGKTVPASDQYALAVIAFEMLTGARPHYPATPVQLFEMQKASGPPDARRLRSDLTPTVSVILRKGMAFDASKRYGSVKEFADDLCRALRGETTTTGSESRRNVILAAGVSFAAILPVYSQRQRIEDFLDSKRDVPKVIEWDGTADPITTGWESRHELVSRWESNADRSGYRGLRLFSKSLGLYLQYWTRAQKKAAMERGWRFAMECQAIEGLICGVVDLTPYRNRFDIHVSARASGEQEFVLHNRMRPSIEGPEFPVPPGLHLYEIVVGPGSTEAQVLIDGNKIASGYKGHSDYQENKNLVWGVGQYKSEKAEGLIRRVRFELL